MPTQELTGRGSLKKKVKSKPGVEVSSKGGTRPPRMGGKKTKKRPHEMKTQGQPHGSGGAHNLTSFRSFTVVARGGGQEYSLGEGTRVDRNR